MNDMQFFERLLSEAGGLDDDLHCELHVFDFTFEEVRVDHSEPLGTRREVPQMLDGDPSCARTDHQLHHASILCGEPAFTALDASLGNGFANKVPLVIEVPETRKGRPPE